MSGFWWLKVGCDPLRKKEMSALFGFRNTFLSVFTPS